MFRRTLTALLVLASLHSAGCHTTATEPAIQGEDAITETTGPAKAAALVGKTAIYDNARCYSAVSYWHGMLGAPIDIGSDFVTAWLTSPLVTTIDGHDLRPGDIIALGPVPRSGVPIEHVAVVNRAGEVFQKAGSPSEFLFEKVAWSAFVARYPELSTARYYRPVKSFAAFLEAGGAQTAAARAMAGELASLEQKLGAFIIIDGEDEAGDDAWADRFDRELRATRQRAAALEADADGQLQAADDGSKWLWRLLKLRASELQTHEGPFS